MRVFTKCRGHRPAPCAATLAALLGFAAFAQAAPFTNGSFESPGGSTTELGVGSTHVTGWVHGVTSGAEFYTTSNHFSIPAGDGTHYITWGGVGIVGGTLSQTFDTTPGTTYAVNYLLTTQQFFAPILPVQSNSVQAFDGATLLNSTTNSFNMAAGVWLAGNQLTFTATSASTTLVFTDTTTPQNSPPINR
ncbi:MAG: DUF642 domain-containing protein, partial [Bryobacterales bacterium]|nr:DUF642 domain-containing protein [Bryobacterales bacterium]